MEVIPITSVQGASKDTVTIKQFEEELQEVVGTKESLVNEGEYNLSQKVTWKVAAVLSNRADVILNGESYDEDLFDQVKEKKRLVGLSGLTSAEMKAARICFVKGIIVGDSMGSYSQARKLRSKDEMTRAEVDKLIERLKSKTKRIKLTTDGQVTRTVNLPKNYKAYDYILASFPNEFYENKFFFLRCTYGEEQVRYKDYAYPKDMKKISWVNPLKQKFVFKDDFAQYGDLWMEKIKTNLETRLNFDYRTADNEWISKLRATYFVFDDAEMDKGKTDSIKKYVKAAKENKVIVKSSKIAVEPSSIYMESGLTYVRCYVKFKVMADTIYSQTSLRQNELVYGSKGMMFTNLKNNTWYEGYFDIQFGGYLGYPSDSDSVCGDYLFYEPGK